MPTIYIKNMVCSRCVLVVQQQLQQLHLPFTEVKLGEVVLEQPLIGADAKAFKDALESVGFGIVDDKKVQTIERIKALLIDLIQNKENNIRINPSEYLSRTIGLDYNYLSGLFSSVENTTIEKYTIQLKIEKVKELLVYHDLNLNEIADRLNYSSVQALSSQFKKVTGLTPSHFKQLKAIKFSS